ncbi:hypothetical protein J4729_20965 [Leisingera sp. HS039]|uniref:hypothetical protein n=1 Tax=unclassified Leisingera TaxID=2614906 RepID=UPI0010710CC6|nr:hypothetical protein [Leisingera sp. NJS201]MBQ4826995.1 hypothetical protein [Leisingera sp. HS039]QBR37466.1 hypothetical protein ETW23_16405 [Leisingera sp. NJS201]
MEGVIHIPAGERGVIRLFALDMRPEQAAFLKEPGALAQVLGIKVLDMDQVEIFPVSDLEDIGLTGYLNEGCGVPRTQVEEDREMLDALDGHVLLIRSRAFDGAETRLTPAEQIILTGTYGERQTNWSAPPATAESAKPNSAQKLSPRQARTQARRIGAALFAVVMLLAALLVWALTV